MNRETIVVSGIGMGTPLAFGREAAWQKIIAGKSLVSEAVSPDCSEEYSPFVRVAPYINPNGLHRIFPLCLSAVQEAVEDAGIRLESIPSDRVGCSVSVSKPILNFSNRPFHSPLPQGERNKKGHIQPSTFHSSVLAPESVLRYLTRQLEISGPTQNIVAACATGVHSILIASRWLEEKKCDIAIAGSAESSLHPLYISGFQKMGVLSEIPRPFDQRRRGFIIGEGAGILVLERKRDVSARGGKVYAEIAGCAVGSDVHHPTSFDSDGLSIASILNKAIKDSRLKIEDIDYVNTHGTGTQVNDCIETKAIKKVFESEAYGLSLSSTKAATGHLLGASASVEAAIACLAIRDQTIPPTANLEKKDPECDLDYTPLQAKNKKINTAISLSFGFGGPIGVIVFKK